MILRVELYGRLKDAGLGDSIEVEIEKKLQVRDLLALLAAKLTKPELLQGAAAATEDRVLGPDDDIDGTSVSILPPVCGG